jgi:beta-lactamase regulating signal transducer with metallopeptidase domain
MNSWTALLPGSLQNAPLVGLVLDVALKSFVILALAATANWCWRRSAASARHLGWLLAVGGLLCLPLLSWILPAWRSPLWTVGAQAESLNELTVTLELTPAKAASGSIAGVLASSPPGTHPAVGRSRGTGSALLAAHVQTGWVVFALTIWLCGAALMMLWLATGQLRLWLLRRSARPFYSEDWVSLLHRLCAELRIRRPVALLRSADDVMPATWGSFRPVILLPAEADEWTPERRRVVLLHELAHVKRWDCLTQMLARLACAIYWFNPLAWLAARRMCVERERACDDLVLQGCKASDYATHLVEIARTFRRLPQMAAIAMARSASLEGRVAAIIDATRVRRAPRAFVVVLCCIAVVGLVSVVAAQKPQSSLPVSSDGTKPWFDARLRAFFSEKAAQARQLAGTNTVAPEVWPFFDAGMRGDWQTATNLWTAMRKRAHQYEGTISDDTLDKVWGPILELDLAWEQYTGWTEKYVLAYGNDIINSIPPGSIYFGGTDPGRGVITAMSKSHVDADPFFTLTQNALADGTYLDYLTAMYGGKIYTATHDDMQNAFDEYSTNAQRRLNEHKLQPGEQVTVKHGKVQVSGQVAVMGINALIAKAIFDHNPDRDFYIEESFPLDWMSPYLSPNGLIMKINRQPLPALSDATVQADHEYWSRYLQPMLGHWLKDDTSVADVTAFVEKIYLKHDLTGFTGDRVWVQDTWAQKAYSKLRSSIGGVYAWRVANSKSPEEKEQMIKAADFAFRQAYALCPQSPEAVFRYANLLVSLGRVNDARLLAETTLKFDPENAQVRGLAKRLKALKPKN